MSVHNKIEKKLNRFEEGKVFDCSFFAIRNATMDAIAQALHRLNIKEKIGKIGRGIYFKPRKTRFGILKPSQEQILSYLMREGDRYVTGLGVYNALGLTTQVPNVITMAANYRKKPQQFGNIRIEYVITKHEIKQEDVPLFQLLDAVRDIKMIPDQDIRMKIRILLNHLKKLGESSRRRLFQLALKYRPATRALVGAMGEYLGERKAVAFLKESLNRITKYRLEIPQEVLPTQQNWNLV